MFLIKSKIFYFILLAAAISFYIFAGEYSAYVAVVLMLTLPVFLYGMTLLTSGNIKISFGECKNVLQKLSPSDINIVIDNTSFFNISNAKLFIETRNIYSNEKSRDIIVIPIISKEKTVIKTALSSRFCGEVEVTLKKIRLYDYLLLTGHTKKLNLRMKAVVMPNTYDIIKRPEPSAMQNDESFNYSKSKAGDDFSQIFDFHEYREGDRVKNIHWKLSTKLDKLIVREPSQPISAAVLIAFELNTGKAKNMRLIDSMIDTLASISSWLFKNELSHELIWYDSAEFCNKKLELTDSNDMFLALESIYNIKPYENNPLLSELAAQTIRLQTSQLFYIACSLDISVIDSLLQISDKAQPTKPIKISIFLMKNLDIPLQPDILHALKTAQINLIEIDINEVETGLQGENEQFSSA